MSRYSATFLFMILGAALLGSTSCTSEAATSPAPPSAVAGQVALTGSKQAADLTIALFSATNPPVRGANVLETVITDGQGQPVTDAQVAFDLDMTNMSHGKNIIVAAPQGNGRYAGQVFFMMPGPWRVIALVQRPGQPVTQTRFDFQVKLR